MPIKDRNIALHKGFTYLPWSVWSGATAGAFLGAGAPAISEITGKTLAGGEVAADGDTFT